LKIGSQAPEFQGRRAGAESYPLAPRIRAVALTRLREDLAPLGSGL